MQIRSKLPELIFRSNNKNNASISILIPTFKRIVLLENAVISAIKQDTNIDYEIIIVDNDQSKKSLLLLKKISQKFPHANLSLYQHTENIGLYGNWNSSLYLGSAEWMTILSDDDLLKPNWLDYMWNAKEHLKDPILLGCDLEFNEKKYSHYNFFKFLLGFYENIFRSKINSRKMSSLDYFIEMPHQGFLGVLFDRNAAIKCGGFDQKYHPSADYNLLAKLSFLNKSYLIKEKLAVYLTGVNISKTEEVVYQGLEVNQKIQVKLTNNLPRKLNFLYKFYIQLFLVRSISGYRKQYRSNPKIKNFIARNKLNFKFNTIFYLITKTLLQILAKLYILKINNEI